MKAATLTKPKSLSSKMLRYVWTFTRPEAETLNSEDRDVPQTSLRPSLLTS